MDPTPSTPPSSTLVRPTSPPGGDGPYRNLWVPLVVVPFLVVGVLVLVFVFFGAIRGKDATLEENLRRVVHGGANERKQAAASLAVQVVENRAASLEGREPQWPVGADFMAELQRAWEEMPPDDNANLRLAVAQLSAHYGDPGAYEKLASFLDTPDGEDPEGEVRVPAMLALSWLGDPRAAEALVPFLTHADPFLRQAAAASLQGVPGPRSLEALRGLLADPSLELRGQAAVSLARLGDDSGAGVLLDLLELETFAQAHLRDPAKFAGEGIVHQARLEAVRALSSLARAEDRPVLEALAADDDDPAVREAAMLALAGKPIPR